MADAGIAPRPAPSSWSEAFASLPLEHAPHGGWSRIATRLPVAASVPRRARRRPWTIAALAATLAIALPVAWQLMREPSMPMPRTTTVRSAADTPRAAQRSDAAPRAAAVAEGPRMAAAVPVDQTTTARPAPRSARSDLPRRAATTRRTVTARPTLAADVASITDRSNDASPTTTPAADLAALRDESARLEALVAYARDETMASGPAAVMSAAVDDRLRLIDAALSQPGTDDRALAALWRGRVDALQELAALEGTQRWMAVHGASMDTVARVD
ncbi:hypothetical protein [Lysobacter humi (ex Lee et al. 2017)]